MIRGTTPTLYFEMPFDTSLIDYGYITFSQNRTQVLDRELSTCTMNGTKISMELSQEETLKLRAKICEIQIRLKTKNGEVLASNIMRTLVDRILKDGVI